MSKKPDFSPPFPPPQSSSDGFLSASLRRPTDRGETKVNERRSGWPRLSCGRGFALSRNLCRISLARAEREGRGSGSTSFLPPPEQCRCPSSPSPSLDLAEKRVGSPVSPVGSVKEGRSERTKQRRKSSIIDSVPPSAAIAETTKAIDLD